MHRWMIVRAVNTPFAYTDISPPYNRHISRVAVDEAPYWKGAGAMGREIRTIGITHRIYPGVRLESKSV